MVTFSTPLATLCYAIVLAGRKSSFRAGFWPDCHRGKTEMGPPAGRCKAPGGSGAKFRGQASGGFGGQDGFPVLETPAFQRHDFSCRSGAIVRHSLREGSTDSPDPLGPKPARNRPQTTPTGPRTTSNCSHMIVATSIDRRAVHSHSEWRTKSGN